MKVSQTLVVTHVLFIFYKLMRFFERRIDGMIKIVNELFELQIRSCKNLIYLNMAQAFYVKNIHQKIYLRNVRNTPYIFKTSLS